MRRLFLLLVLLFPLVNAESIPIIGVVTRGDAYVGELTVDFLPGEAQVIIQQNLQSDTIQSVLDALNAAAPDPDFSLRIEYDMNSLSVGGKSGSAALAVLVRAHVLELSLKPNSTVSGSIDINGNLIKTGDLLRKINAAADAGIKTLVVPPGSSLATVYVQYRKLPFEIYEPYYITKQINLTEYCGNLGVQLIEAATLDEVVSALSGSYLTGLLQ